MFDRFSDHARKAMGEARQQSQNWCHDYIGTEHMLLGLLEIPDSDAVALLSTLEVDLERLRENVKSLMSPGDKKPPEGQIPFTPNAKKALEFSLVHASNLGHHHLGTTHLLLGLTNPGIGLAPEALKRSNVTKDRLVEAAVKHLPAQKEREPTKRQRGPLSTLIAEVKRLGDEMRELRERVEELERRLGER